MTFWGPKKWPPNLENYTDYTQNTVVWGFVGLVGFSKYLSAFVVCWGFRGFLLKLDILKSPETQPWALNLKPKTILAVTATTTVAGTLSGSLFGNP